MVPSGESDRLRRIDSAFRLGDLSALRAEFDRPADVPNGPMPQAIGPCLIYAIYHSPLQFVAELLELGANPNLEAHDGFPPLFAAVWKSDRSDTPDLIGLLLSYGADPNQRGHNDFTVLHAAVHSGNRQAVELLLAAGADPRLRTRIDDYETPAELASSAGLAELADLIRGHPSESRT